jgi:hypothetical protein
VFLFRTNQFLVFNYLYIYLIQLVFIFDLKCINCSIWFSDAKYIIMLLNLYFMFHVLASCDEFGINLRTPSYTTNVVDEMNYPFWWCLIYDIFLIFLQCDFILGFLFIDFFNSYNVICLWSVCSDLWFLFFSHSLFNDIGFKLFWFFTV